MIKAVLFDLDGTLLNTNDSVCLGYKTIFDKYKPEMKVDRSFLESLLGPSLSEIIPKYFKEDLQTLIYEYREGADSYMDKEHIKPYPKALETLDGLHKLGIKVALVTSRSVKSSLKLLEMFDIKYKFDLMVCFEDVKNPKPSPEGINLALKKLNVKPDETIMVGDHGHDVSASKAASVISVGVGYSIFGKENLLKMGANYIVDSMDDLFNIIKERS